MLRNRTLILSILSLLLFWPVAWFVPRLVVFDFVNALSISLGAFVIWAYMPGVVIAARSDDGLQRQHYLILGIFATWIAMLFRTVWLWGWRYMGEPDEGLDHLFFAFIAWLVVVGGVFHLLAPRVLLDGRIPKSGWSTLVAALAFGLLLGGIIAYVR